MKLSEIKNQLKKLTTIAFQLPNGELVPSHFHVTEVGKITKHFIDCGGVVRNGAPNSTTRRGSAAGVDLPARQAWIESEICASPRGHAMEIDRSPSAAMHRQTRTPQFDTIRPRPACRSPWSRDLQSGWSRERHARRKKFPHLHVRTTRKYP